MDLTWRICYLGHPSRLFIHLKMILGLLLMYKWVGLVSVKDRLIIASCIEIKYCI